MPNPNVNRRVVLGGNRYDPDAQAYFNRLDPQPDVYYKNAVNNFVMGCKADGNWTLDRCWIYGNPNGNQQWARISIPNPTSTPITEVNSPTWGVMGYTGNGVDSYLNLNIAPNQGTYYTQDSCAYGCYIRTDATNVLISIGVVGAYMYPRYTDGKVYAQIQSSEVSGAVANSKGLYVNYRSGTTFGTYKRGVSVSSAVSASSARATSSWFSLCLRNGANNPSEFDTRQKSFEFIGDLANKVAFDARVETLAVALGWNV